MTLWSIKNSANIQNTDVAWLWTSATLDVWTGANQVVQLDWDWKLPAIDWSNITWVSQDLSWYQSQLQWDTLPDAWVNDKVMYYKTDEDILYRSNWTSWIAIN